MSTVDNTATEAKSPAEVPETHCHHHGGIIGKFEDVFHSVSKKLHVKHDKSLHPEAEKEHQEPVGAVGVKQEVSTTLPEAEQDIGSLGAGPVGIGGPPAPRPL